MENFDKNSICRGTEIMLSRSRSLPSVVCRLQYKNADCGKLRCLSSGTVAKNRRILAQGQGVFGSLGQGPDLFDSEKYTDISFFTSPIKLASAGWGHSAAVNENGNLFIFGRPYDFTTIMRISKVYKFSAWFARYVASSSNSELFGSELGYFPTPQQVETNEPVKDLSCSAGLTVFLTEKGDAYSFGLNKWSQCGVPVVDSPYVLQPVRVPNLPPCQSLEAGLQHCVALTKDGDVYTWGKASKGQLGNINIFTKEMPPFFLAAIVPLEPEKTGSVATLKVVRREKSTHRPEPEHLKATQISAGFSHSAALSTAGDVYVWGRGMSADIRDKLKGTIVVCEDQLIPRKLVLPEGRKAVQICSSNFHLVILAEDGSLWAIGMGEQDKNANPQPLRVQTDFHLPGAAATAGADGSVSRHVTATAEVDATDGRNYVLVPTPAAGTRLCKGHQRVALIVREAPLSESATAAAATEPRTSSSSSDIIIAPSSKNRANFPEQGAFEVVVHEGEAYLIELSLPIEKVTWEGGGGMVDPQLHIVNHSSGWKHNLLIVEDL